MYIEIIELYNKNKNYYIKHLRNNIDMLNYLNITFSWTTDIKEQVYCLRNNITVQPMCKYDKCDKPANFKGMTEGYGVGGCSRKHGQFISNLEKYGYEMPFNNYDIQQKTKVSCMVKYGVDNPMKVKEISNKTSETRINYTNEQKQQYLQRRKVTWQENYGVDNIFKDTSYIQSKVLEKFGVINVAQVPEIAERRSNTPKSNVKDYIWNDGLISRVQGYENIVLHELEYMGYKSSEVLTKKSDMPEIWYIGDDGKKHRYYADFYIPKENLVIEVKSAYTMLYDFLNNNKKAVATKVEGYRYKLEVR